MSALQEILQVINSLPEDKLATLEKEVLENTGKWVPNPGPQMLAAMSEADVVLYGGQGGGGKTDLLIGLALTEHKRSLIMRRQYSDLNFITERAIQVNGSRQGFSGSIPPKLRTSDGRLIEFGGAKNAGDGKSPGDEEHWQGQPHDFLGLDEATQFAESQVRFLMGWLRSSEEGQRCRTILATNPPLSSAGDWIIGMFAPWLDPMWANEEEGRIPAQPGELRWVVTTVDEHTGESVDLWVDGPDVQIPSGKFNDDGSPRFLVPKSRTFIPARVDDNPFYAGTRYQAELDALPEPIRSAVRDGNFMAAREDEERQVIPSLWVKQAQQRWRKTPPHGIPMCAIGVDGARVKDRNVLSPRHDGWFAKQILVPTPDVEHGRDLAAEVIKARRDGALVVVDVLEEIGAQCEAHLSANDIECFSYRGGEDTPEKTREGKLYFYNRRAAAYWVFREGLDPSQDGGALIDLPVDPELETELTAVTFDIVTRQGDQYIKLITKDKVVEKIGRSPDKADSAVMSWYRGARALTHMPIWQPDERVGPAAHYTRRGKGVKSNYGPRRQRRR